MCWHSSPLYCSLCRLPPIVYLHSSRVDQNSCSRQPPADQSLPHSPFCGPDVPAPTEEARPGQPPSQPLPALPVRLSVKWHQSNFSLFRRCIELFAAEFEAGEGYQSLRLSLSVLAPIEGFAVGHHPLVCRIFNGTSMHDIKLTL